MQSMRRVKQVRLNGSMPLSLTLRPQDHERMNTSELICGHRYSNPLAGDRTILRTSLRSLRLTAIDKMVQLHIYRWLIRPVKANHRSSI